MRVTLRLGLGFHGCQPLQDATGLDRLVGRTAVTQGYELSFEVSEFPYALVHVVDMLIKDRVDGTATLGGLIHQTEQ